MVYLKVEGRDFFNSTHRDESKNNLCIDSIGLVSLSIYKVFFINCLNILTVDDKRCPNP